MNICVIGTGYVGLVTGTSLAEIGNSVICIDNDEKKIKDLKNALITGRELGVPLPAASLVQSLFISCDASGRGNLDHGALIIATEDLAKTKVGG